jgi:hypothetical protein
MPEGHGHPLVMSNWNWYMGDFLKSFVWLSMDHSQDNFNNNYLIFKLNYFIFIKKITSFSYYFPPFLITTSIL